MARRDLRDQVAAQVRAAVAAGATVLCGGDPRDDLGGFFNPPTVLGDVTPAVSVYREEVFGPVAAIITVADAIRPSRWPTTPRSGWAPACGAPVSKPPSRSGGASPPAPASSTPWWDRHGEPVARATWSAMRE